MDRRTKTDLRRPPFLRRDNKPLPLPTGDEEQAMLFGETDVASAGKIAHFPPLAPPPPAHFTLAEEPPDGERSSSASGIPRE